MSKPIPFPAQVRDETNNVKLSVYRLDSLANSLRNVGLDRSADIIDEECGLINASLCNLNNIVDQHVDEELRQAKWRVSSVLKDLADSMKKMEHFINLANGFCQNCGQQAKKSSDGSTWQFDDWNCPGRP